MKKMKVRFLLGGVAVGAMLAATVAPDANADGYDPDFVKNSTHICGVLDTATTVKPVQDLFRYYGRQYVTDTVYRGCPRHNLAVYAALQGFKMQEDDPGWDCAVDGNQICGKDPD